MNVASALALLIINKGLGLYSVVIASYLGSLIPMVIYLLMNRESSIYDIVINAITYLFLTIAGSLSYLLIINSWPLYQLGIFLVSLIVTYLLKPIPRSVIDQLPDFARPMLMPFTQVGE
ncbi:hypothetical protein [Vulcanisaeta sp. JCM 16161]|uniref:hypothetical protein n=1 Tax=Vulcanisaeta sp. JCM 16161 TaxID=1295372 RepID=UPI000A69F336|nr:hypothetical protein [Vulcanisaeta sp. JCM 16161]